MINKDKPDLPFGTFQFGFGWSGTLEEQANKLGYTLGSKAELMEELREALHKVSFYGIIPDDCKAYKTFHEEVLRWLKKLED